MPQPFNHFCKPRLILTTNDLELQTKPTPSANIAHGGIGPDLSILNKEMKFNRRADGAYLACFDKEATHAQISNSRRVFSVRPQRQMAHTPWGVQCVCDAFWNEEYFLPSCTGYIGSLCLRTRWVGKKETQCLI